MSPERYARFTNLWHCYVAKGRSQGLMHDIEPRRCALVIVDVQEECVEPDRFIGFVGKHDDELAARYKKRLDEVVWPQLEKLIEFFRSKNMLVIYTVFALPKSRRSASETSAGRRR